MGRTIFLDAVILSAGATFILYLIARMLDALLIG
jgi:hypothetical protein